MADEIFVSEANFSDKFFFDMRENSGRSKNLLSVSGGANRTLSHIVVADEIFGSEANFSDKFFFDMRENSGRSRNLFSVSV